LGTPMSGSKCSWCTFDTTDIVNGTITEYVLVSGLSADAHEIRIMKTSEPEWNDREPSPNWVTFHGLTLDAGNVSAPSTPRRQRRVEFIGDSITAGYCNLCPGASRPDLGDGVVAASLGSAVGDQSFALSWPTVLCERLDAECSTVAWSGMGLVKNCCGGQTKMPEIWKRTLATDNTTNWDFSSWVPDALVVNLGTNDQGMSPTVDFVRAYEKLVHDARLMYGNRVHVFLACGPMTEKYCDSVQKTLTNATESGIQAHFLDQRDFLNGSFGPRCCSHPSAQVAAAMGAAAAEQIANELGWTMDTLIV